VEERAGLRPVAQLSQSRLRQSSSTSQTGATAPPLYVQLNIDDGRLVRLSMSACKAKPTTTPRADASIDGSYPSPKKRKTFFLPRVSVLLKFSSIVTSTGPLYLAPASSEARVFLVHQERRVFSLQRIMLRCPCDGQEILFLPRHAYLHRCWWYRHQIDASTVQQEQEIGGAHG
jgi:hypothetical protein